MNWLEEQKRQNELNRQNLINSYSQGRTGDYLKNTASVIDSGSKLLQGGTNAANFGQKVQDFGSKLGNYDNSFIKGLGNGIAKTGKGITDLGNEFQGKIDNGISGITNKFSSFGGQGGNQAVSQAVDNAINNVTSNGAIGDAINNSVNGIADNGGALSGALESATSGSTAGGLNISAPGLGTVTKGLSSAGDIANGDYVKGGLGAVSTIAPLFGGVGMGIGLAADLGSMIFDIFGGNEEKKAQAMAQSQKGLENIQSFSNQKKDENARQLEQQGNAMQQQLAQNSGMQDLYGAYQAGQPTYDDYIKEIYGL